MALRTSSGRSTTARPGAAVPQARSPGRRSGLILGLALFAQVALGIGYATRTPMWQNPDEPAHYNYVAQVAETGTLPELKPGDWDSALLSRVQNGSLQPGDSIASIRYEGWQPPLSYLAEAPVYLVGSGDPAARLLRLRLFGVALGAATLVLAFCAACYVFDESLAAVVALTIAGIPMFSAVSASLSADPLANALAALLVLVLLQAHTRPVRTGLLLGVALVTKLALVIYVPLALWRVRRDLRSVVPMLATAALVTLPWLIHQVTIYGWMDPLATQRHAQVVVDQPRFAGLTLQYVVDFVTVSFHSFWAQFGWMAIPAPDRLYFVWGGLSLLALGGLAWRRDWLRDPRWQLLVATLVCAVVAYIVYNLAFTQFQGRYLFTALVPIACVLVAGWSAWLPVRYKLLGTFAIAALLVALNAYALVRVLTPGFAPSG
jgi:4-amino-4-deoxy-L-arabinose transferase-like glycosyltransferase